MTNYREISRKNIKAWFLSKSFTCEERAALNKSGEFIYSSETEKAVRYIVDTDYGQFGRWIPKSCIMSNEELEAEEKAEEARFAAGCEKYQKMIEWAKAHQVKGVRSGMRKETILNKIKAAGLTYAN